MGVGEVVDDEPPVGASTGVLTDWAKSPGEVAALARGRTGGCSSAAGGRPVKVSA